MTFAKIVMSVAAASMAVAPAVAANPAAGLSIAPSVKALRAVSKAGKKSNIGQTGIIAIVVIATGGAIAGIVAGTTGRNNATSA